MPQTRYIIIYTTLKQQGGHHGQRNFANNRNNFNYRSYDLFVIDSKTKKIIGELSWKNLKQQKDKKLF